MLRRIFEAQVAGIRVFVVGIGDCGRGCGRELCCVVMDGEI